MLPDTKPEVRPFWGQAIKRFGPTRNHHYKCSAPFRNLPQQGTAKMTQADLLQQGKLELVLDLKGDLLEGPVWDDRIKRLHFVDINGQLIHTLDPDTKSQHPRYLITTLLVLHIFSQT